MSNVRQLPGAHRPHGALSWLGEALADESVRGVVVAVVDQDGNADPRVFGEVRLKELAWIGAVLAHHAMTQGEEGDE